MNKWFITRWRLYTRAHFPTKFLLYTTTFIFRCNCTLGFHCTVVNELLPGTLWKYIWIKHSIICVSFLVLREAAVVVDCFLFSCNHVFEGNLPNIEKKKILQLLRNKMVKNFPLWKDIYIKYNCNNENYTGVFICHVWHLVSFIISYSITTLLFVHSIDLFSLLKIYI